MQVNLPSAEPVSLRALSAESTGRGGAVGDQC